MFLLLLSETSWVRIHGVISEFSIPFHWSVISFCVSYMLAWSP
jgi:hypothetical protein